eukprot:2199307-Amphidinium_carterae.1
MFGSSHGALDVALVSQVRALLFYNDDISRHYGETLQETCDIGKLRQCATIRMGSGGSAWAKPPSPQRADCISFEDLLCLALWLGFGTVGHESGKRKHGSSKH